MEKLDLTKLYKSYYTATPKPELIEIAPARFLSITGKGDPSAPEFAANTQAMYATAYGIKFACKALNKDFVVAKLEGLWSFDESKYGGLSIADAPRNVPRSEWEYRLLIRMPEFVTSDQVASMTAQIVEKKQIDQAARVELYEMSEGLCIQVLHTGPFENEPQTLELVSAFIKEEKLAKNGLHHEIYLSDFNKTAPEKLKTILREPVRRI